MKIRNRLTLTLALTSFTAVAALGVLVYWFTARFHEREFFSRLEERVALAEQIFLEKNETVSQAVRERFLQRLDEEREYAFTLKASGLDSMANVFGSETATRMAAQPVFHFCQNERHGVSKHYRLAGGTYAVVVTAVDVFGKTKLSNLKKILLAGGALCSMLLVVVSWVSVRRVLRPLENKIHKASRIRPDRLDVRLSVENPNDELGELALAFNKMLDRLQRAFEAQRAFVRNASHEMRNPLTAIIGEADLLLSKDRSPDEYREALQIIQIEAQRLENLTRQLLDLEKAEALASLPAPEEVTLDRCLLEAIEKFPIRRFRLRLPEGEQLCIVTGNRSLLHIAISNLLDNALKYSGDQPVDVELVRTGNQFRISVIDQGIGIPASDLGNIFYPLHRASNALAMKGHGIGLPLAKKIIELHGGSIEVNSEENKGSAFYLNLPAIS